MKNIKTALAFAAGMTPEERRSLIRQISHLSGPPEVMVDLDTRFPPDAPLSEIIPAVKGMVISALVAGTEGVTAGDIPKLAISAATGVPAFNPSGEPIPVGALGPFELFAVLGAYNGDDIPFEDADSEISDVFERLQQDELDDLLSDGLGIGDVQSLTHFLDTGDESMLTGGVKKALKKLKDKRKAKKEAKKGVPAKTVSASTSDSKMPNMGIISTKGTPESREPWVISPAAQQSVIDLTTTAISNTSPASISASMDQMKKVIDYNLKQLKMSSDSLAVMKRDYARLVVAAGALSAHDQVAEAFLLYPLDFSSLEEYENSILPYVQNGASRNFKMWFSTLKADLAGLFNKKAEASPLFPVPDVTMNAASPLLGDNDAVIDPQIIRNLDLSSSANMAFLDPETYEGDVDIDDVYAQLSDDLQRSGEGDVPNHLISSKSFRPPHISNLGEGEAIVEKAQTGLLTGVEGTGRFVQDMWNKATPSQKVWLGAAGALATTALAGRMFRNRPIFFGSNDVHSGAEQATLSPTSTSQLTLSDTGASMTTYESALPASLKNGTPADLGYQWFLIGKAFDERKKLQPWVQFRPVAMAGGIDPEIPFSSPFYIEDDGSVSGSVHKYADNLMEGGKFWDGLKKVGKVIGNVISSPAGQAILGVLPGGGTLGSAARIAMKVGQNIAANKAGSTPPETDSTINQWTAQLMNSEQAYRDNQYIPPMAVYSTPSSVGSTSSFSAAPAIMPYAVYTSPSTIIDRSSPAFRSDIVTPVTDLPPATRLGFDFEGSVNQTLSDAWKRFSNFLSPSPADDALLRATVSAAPPKPGAYTPIPIGGIAGMVPPRLTTGDLQLSPDNYRSVCDGHLLKNEEFRNLVGDILEQRDLPDDYPLEGGVGGLKSLWSIVRGSKLFSGWSKVSREVGGQTGQSMGASLTQPGPVPKSGSGKGGLSVIFGGVASFLKNMGLLQRVVGTVASVGVIAWFMTKYNTWSKRKENVDRVKELLGPEDYDKYVELLDKAEKEKITEEEQFVLGAYMAKITGHTTMGGEQGEVNPDGSAEVNSSTEMNEELLKDGELTDAGESAIEKALPFIIAAGGVGLGALVMKSLVRRKSGADAMVIPVAFTGEPAFEREIYAVRPGQYDPFRRTVELPSGQCYSAEIPSVDFDITTE